MTAADNRRVPGWRILREYLNTESDSPSLFISQSCQELIRCLSALLCDATRPEDASDEPHNVTHAPEALRYAVMSRFGLPMETDPPDRNFRLPNAKPRRLSRLI
jgi:hypothetical protein